MYSNSDSEIDSVEFLNFLKHNESALNITYSNTVETNLLLRYCPNSFVSKLRKNNDRNIGTSKYRFCVSVSDPCVWTL